MSTSPVLLTGLGGGVNWYAYAGNDPVNYRDPTGLSMKADPEPEPQGCQVSYATDLSWMNIDIGGCDFGPDPQPPAGGSGGPHPGEGPAPGGGGNGGGEPVKPSQAETIFRDVGRRVRPLDNYGKCFAGSVVPNAIFGGAVSGVVALTDARVVAGPGMSAAGGAATAYVEAASVIKSAVSTEVFGIVNIASAVGSYVTCALAGRDVIGTIGSLTGTGN